MKEAHEENAFLNQLRSLLPLRMMDATELEACAPYLSKLPPTKSNSYRVKHVPK